MKERNEAKIKELEAKQKEMMPLMTKVMFNSFKPMIVILPTYIILFWLINMIIPSFAIELGFGIPIFHPRTIYGTRGFFVLITLIIGFPLGLVVSHIEKKNLIKEQKQKE